MKSRPRQKDVDPLALKDTSFSLEGGRLTIVNRREVVRIALYTPDDKLSMGYYSHDDLIQLLEGYEVVASRNVANGIITSVYKTKLDIQSMELSLFILDKDLATVTTKDPSIIADKYLKETRLSFLSDSWGIFVGHLERLSNNVL